MSRSRWDKKKTPRAGQVWQHNARFSIGELAEEADPPVYLVLDEARMDWRRWDLTLLNLTTGHVVEGSVRGFNMVDWERIA